MTRQDPSAAFVEEDHVGVSDQPQRLPRAEVVNTITHGIGFLLSIAGSLVLMNRAIHYADAWRIVGCGVFSATLIAVYAASTLSHCFVDPRLRNLFRNLDQGFIYFLIVGTYTPFSLAFLRTAWWWVFLGIMWTIALIGFSAKVLFAHRVEGVAVWSYVLLGWLPILPVGAMIGAVPATALWWMLAGGLCYTGGTIFLVLDIERYHFHAIWHLLVIAGSTCHFFAIFVFVAEAPVSIM